MFIVHTPCSSVSVVYYEQLNAGWVELADSVLPSNIFVTFCIFRIALCYTFTIYIFIAFPIGTCFLQSLSRFGMSKEDYFSSL